MAYVDGFVLALPKANIEAYKEQEDVRGPVANTAGGATFQINQPLQRDLNLVVGQAEMNHRLAGREIAARGDKLAHLGP